MEQEKDKAKVQDEEVLQEEPEFEIPKPLLTQQEIDTARLNSLLLASTLMQIKMQLEGAFQNAKRLLREHE